MLGAELLFWSDLRKDDETPSGCPIKWEKSWLCLRESYFNFLLASGYPLMGAIKQLMFDARTVNGPD